MDSFMAVVLGGLAAILGLAFGARKLRDRRRARRVEEARTADIVRVPVSGPPLNRRVIVWMLPTLAACAAAGLLTGKDGPISRSNVFFAVSFGVVLVVGSIGAGISAMRRIGTVELNRA